MNSTMDLKTVRDLIVGLVDDNPDYVFDAKALAATVSNNDPDDRWTVSAATVVRVAKQMVAEGLLLVTAAKPGLGGHSTRYRGNPDRPAVVASSAPTPAPESAVVPPAPAGPSRLAQVGDPVRSDKPGSARQPRPRVGASEPPEWAVPSGRRSAST